jgi:hypothetical protein
MDYALEKYRHMWAPLIEPDDFQYTQADIAPKDTTTPKGVHIRRKDFTTKNSRG